MQLYAHVMSSELVDDGLYFVGMDVVGDKVVEINAESAVLPSRPLDGLGFRARN